VDKTQTRVRGSLGSALIPTVLFVVLIIALERSGSSGQMEGLLVKGWMTVPAIALIVTPFMWMWMASRGESLLAGVLAGAATSAAILVWPTISLIGQARAGHDKVGYDVAIASIGLLWWWGVGLAVGAGIGFVSRVYERWVWKRRAS
jgi:hypothetical protein